MCVQSDAHDRDGFGYVDGLVQERHNSSALAMELCLYCTKPLG